MAVNWFPGHMAKAVRDIQARIRLVDLVMEIRDARIPLSSSINVQLEESMKSKLRVVVLNKMDLANKNLEKRWGEYFSAQGLRHTFVSTRQHKSVRKLLQEVRQLLMQARPKADTHLAMVVGIPNVGKSSLINMLHRIATGPEEASKRAKVGPLPGVTRGLAGFKICDKPSAFLLDTPGVMVPNIQDVQVGMCLALTGAVKDPVVGELRIARFLLQALNKRPGVVRQLRMRVGEKERAAEEERAVNKGLRKGLSKEKTAVLGSVASDMVAVADVLWQTVGGSAQSSSAHLEGHVGDDDKEVAESSSASQELVEEQLVLLRRRLRVPAELGEEGGNLVAKRLLRLYREGSFGAFTLDMLPEGGQKGVG